MMDLQTYLVSEGNEFNRAVGDELTFQFDATRYLPKVKRRFQPQVDLEQVDQAAGLGQAQVLRPGDAELLVEQAVEVGVLPPGDRADGPHRHAARRRASGRAGCAWPTGASRARSGRASASCWRCSP